MTYKIHVEFRDGVVVDVESENLVDLHTMINETTKKFFPDDDVSKYNMKLLLKEPNDLAKEAT